MMKKPLLLLAFLLCIFTASAQNFEGTWKGTMIQDSPVVRINFEMVLEQKEGKISGYLYRLFIVDDSLIYNTVRVTARVADSLLIVEDEEANYSFIKAALRSSNVNIVWKQNHMILLC